MFHQCSSCDAIFSVVHRALYQQHLEAAAGGGGVTAEQSPAQDSPSELPQPVAAAPAQDAELQQAEQDLAEAQSSATVVGAAELGASTQDSERFSLEGLPPIGVAPWDVPGTLHTDAATEAPGVGDSEDEEQAQDRDQVEDVEPPRVSWPMRMKSMNSRPLVALASSSPGSVRSMSSSGSGRLRGPSFTGPPMPLPHTRLLSPGSAGRAKSPLRLAARPDHLVSLGGHSTGSEPQEDAAEASGEDEEDGQEQDRPPVDHSTKLTSPTGFGWRLGAPRDLRMSSLGGHSTASHRSSARSTGEDVAPAREGDEAVAGVSCDTAGGGEAPEQAALSKGTLHRDAFDADTVNTDPAPFCILAPPAELPASGACSLVQSDSDASHISIDLTQEAPKPYEPVKASGGPQPHEVLAALAAPLVNIADLLLSTGAATTAAPTGLSKHCMQVRGLADLCV